MYILGWRTKIVFNKLTWIDRVDLCAASIVFFAWRKMSKMQLVKDTVSASRKKADVGRYPSHFLVSFCYKFFMIIIIFLLFLCWLSSGFSDAWFFRVHIFKLALFVLYYAAPFAMPKWMEWNGWLGGFSHTHTHTHTLRLWSCLHSGLHTTTHTIKCLYYIVWNVCRFMANACISYSTDCVYAEI